MEEVIRRSDYILMTHDPLQLSYDDYPCDCKEFASPKHIIKPPLGPGLSQKI
jgi:hypothetical protein